MARWLALPLSALIAGGSGAESPFPPLTAPLMLDDGVTTGDGLMNIPGVYAMSFGRSFLLFVPIVVMAGSAACSQSTAPHAADGMTLNRFLDRQTDRIMAADTDGDGRVSRAEMDAIATKGGRDPWRRFDAMDANHDGYLDKAEIQALLTNRFHRMDRNGDGVLTADERMALQMRRGQAQRAGMPAAQP